MIAIVAVVGTASALTFLCSLSESTLVSLSDARVEAMRAAEVPGVDKLAKLRETRDESINAILTMNTIVHTVGSAASGVLVEWEFGPQYPFALPLFCVLYTIYLLLFMEIAPRTIGLVYPEKWAPVGAWWTKTCIVTLYPVVKLCAAVSSVLSRRANVHASAPTEEEILAMARIGAQQGTLDKDEATWATNALLLDGVTAKDLMTPRTVVYLLPQKLPLSMVKAHAAHWTHSRLPVCADDDPDRILGLIYRRDVFDALVQKPREELEKLTLGDLKHPARFAPESTPGNELLSRMLREREQFFVVANEFGAMEGIITLEDVLEFLLGEEIVDPHDAHVDMREHAVRLAAERRRRVSSRPPAEPPGAVSESSVTRPKTP